jgi:hypothetical protein
MVKYAQIVDNAQYVLFISVFWEHYHINLSFVVAWPRG